MDTQFWRGRRILLTGHTGFKGSWLSLWLQKLGAVVAGYALPPSSSESLFELAQVGCHMESVYGDLRDRMHLQSVIDGFRPEIVFHLAAQPLVRKSYAEPVETFEVNVMGTVHLLEALRTSPCARVLVSVTSDKCYENREWVWGYRENDPLGGYDPYSSSKACAEIVTAAYRRSFFEHRTSGQVAVASARAGNVIGGGDFSPDRIIPDAITAMRRREPLRVRNPDAIRPWQHVLEPLCGYLLLARRLWEHPGEYAQSWNFGPEPDDIRSVAWIVQELSDCCGGRLEWQIDQAPQPHEARLLVLDSTKARMLLGWRPRWTVRQALQQVAAWQSSYDRGEQMRNVSLRQIDAYEHQQAPASLEVARSTRTSGGMTVQAS